LIDQHQEYGVQYGVFVCSACRDSDTYTDDSTADPLARVLGIVGSVHEDRCCLQDSPCRWKFAGELPPLWLADAWPACRCCGRPVQLLAPLTAS
jgi:hypothetical protein